MFALNWAQISYLKSVDVYLVSCFFMVFSALLEYAAVSYLGNLKWRPKPPIVTFTGSTLQRPPPAGTLKRHPATDDCNLNSSTLQVIHQRKPTYYITNIA